MKITAAQQKILDAIADSNSNDGRATIDRTPNTMKSCEALQAKGLITIDGSDEERIIVQLARKDDDEAETTATKKKAGRPVWDNADATNAHEEPCKRDADGKLLEVPWNFPKGHYPMQRGEFSNVALWHDWLAVECERKIHALAKRAAKHRADATDIRNAGSPEHKLRQLREKHERLAAKMKEEEEAILAELQAAKEEEEEALTQAARGGNKAS